MQYILSHNCCHVFTIVNEFLVVFVVFVTSLSFFRHLLSPCVGYRFFHLCMMMMMIGILLQNVMMMIKDEQELTKTLDHSDTGQAHMKT